MQRIASRLNGVSESATLKLNALVQSMRAQGIDVVNLTAGEPDFAVPEAAKQAVIESVKLNRSKYTAASGIVELRQAIADKTNAQQPTVAAQRPWKASDVVVTNGGKQALFNLFLAILNSGDEVLIPSPYWLSYPDMVRIAGGLPKFIQTSVKGSFKITPRQLKESLTPRVKALVLNSPSNPTGSMYSKEEFRELAEVLLREKEGQQVFIISDEIYDRIALGGTRFCSFLESAPELRDRVVTVNGMSKSAAMTGWRVGWAVGPEDVIQAMGTLQGQSTSNVNSLAQYAALTALKLPESEFAEQVESFRERRDLCLEILSKAGTIELCAPEGAFYIFLGVAQCLKPGEDSAGFAERLLKEARVAVVPGTPFGEPDFVRISFATDRKALEEGCRRIVQFISR